MRRVEDVIAPFVKERGLESELQIDELPADLWDRAGLGSTTLHALTTAA
jgi:hypothetical protein